MHWLVVAHEDEQLRLRAGSLTVRRVGGFGRNVGSSSSLARDALGEMERDPRRPVWRSGESSLARPDEGEVRYGPSEAVKPFTTECHADEVMSPNAGASMLCVISKSAHAKHRGGRMRTDRYVFMPILRLR